MKGKGDKGGDSDVDDAGVVRIITTEMRNVLLRDGGDTGAGSVAGTAVVGGGMEIKRNSTGYSNEDFQNT